MLTYSIFVVDDEQTIREGISLALEADFTVTGLASADEALQKLHQEVPDLILLDIGLPGMNGIEALQRIKQTHPEVLVIMITAYEDIKTVVSAMKLGAYDYVLKPLHMDSLEITIRNAFKTIELKKQIHLLQEKYLQENLPCFIGESQSIQEIMEFIGMVARSPDTPILIMGQTGTGKELIASAIHYRSPHFQGPLISVNCAAIPKDLIESELFGYEKGAFSGALITGKKGLIEEASQGTLFLDEVGDLNLDAQAKLLRFLETGEFYRVGGTRKMVVRSRIVSATNKDLEALMKKELFRTDLYFRLGVIKVQVPSLNERPTDILLLARYFLHEYSRKFERKLSGFSLEAEVALTSHHWTGNVRELKNMIERGVLTARGENLSPKDLGFAEHGSEIRTQESVLFTPLPSEGLDLTTYLNALEKYYLEQAYQRSGGNESQAARLLHLNHHTYRYRRKKLQE